MPCLQGHKTVFQTAKKKEVFHRLPSFYFNLGNAIFSLKFSKDNVPASTFLVTPSHYPATANGLLEGTKPGYGDSAFDKRY